MTRGTVFHNTRLMDSPRLTSAITVGLVGRMKSVCHNFANSPRMASRRSSAWSGGGSSSNAERWSRIADSFRRTLRRLASVGWAVKTSSMCSESHNDCIADASTPDALSDRTAAAIDSSGSRG